MKKFFVAIFCLASLTLSAQTQTVQVLEYHPAPGQFVNTLPTTADTTTHAQACALCEESLQSGSLVHLGTYGGYMTVKFDHPVQNLKGSDFRITGNGFYSTSDPVYGSETIGGSFEPGIVYVGVGDDVSTAAWYELAGSEYYTTEIHDFQITYYKPTAETGDHSIQWSIYDNYLPWKCHWTENGVEKDSTGYHMKISFHKQTYWPYWEGDSITYKGGKVPNNAIDQSGSGTNWILYRYAKDAYGYADASLNTDDYSTFDIDWAVDSAGNAVQLDQINFIKVVCGIFQYCGWIGETSTEIAGFQDLHLVEGYDDDPIVITPKPNPNAGTVSAIESNQATVTCIYDLSGRQIRSLAKGLNIVKYSDGSVKKIWER